MTESFDSNCRMGLNPMSYEGNLIQPLVLAHLPTHRGLLLRVSICALFYFYPNYCLLVLSLSLHSLANHDSSLQPIFLKQCFIILISFLANYLRLMNFHFKSQNDQPLQKSLQHITQQFSQRLKAHFCCNFYSLSEQLVLRYQSIFLSS